MEKMFGRDGQFQPSAGTGPSLSYGPSLLGGGGATSRFAPPRGQQQQEAQLSQVPHEYPVPSAGQLNSITVAGGYSTSGISSTGLPPRYPSLARVSTSPFRSDNRGGDALSPRSQVVGFSAAEYEGQVAAVITAPRRARPSDLLIPQRINDAALTKAGRLSGGNPTMRLGPNSLLDDRGAGVVGTAREFSPPYSSSTTLLGAAPSIAPRSEMRDDFGEMFTPNGYRQRAAATIDEDYRRSRSAEALPMSNYNASAGDQVPQNRRSSSPVQQQQQQVAAGATTSFFPQTNYRQERGTLSGAERQSLQEQYQQSVIRSEQSSKYQRLRDEQRLAAHATTVNDVIMPYTAEARADEARDQPTQTGSGGAGGQQRPNDGHRSQRAGAAEAAKDDEIMKLRAALAKMYAVARGGRRRTAAAASTHDESAVDGGGDNATAQDELLIDAAPPHVGGLPNVPLPLEVTGSAEMHGVLDMLEVEDKKLFRKSWKPRFVFINDRLLAVYRDEVDFRRHHFHKALIVVPFHDLDYFVPSFTDPQLADTFARLSMDVTALATEQNAGVADPHAALVAAHHRDVYTQILAITNEYARDQRFGYFGFIAKQPTSTATSGSSSAAHRNPQIVFRTSSMQEHSEWVHKFARVFNRKLYREMFPSLLAETLFGLVCKSSQTNRVETASVEVQLEDEAAVAASLQPAATDGGGLFSPAPPEPPGSPPTLGPAGLEGAAVPAEVVDDRLAREDSAALRLLPKGCDEATAARLADLQAQLEDAYTSVATKDRHIMRLQDQLGRMTVAQASLERQVVGVTHEKDDALEHLAVVMQTLDMSEIEVKRLRSAVLELNEKLIRAVKSNESDAAMRKEAELAAAAQPCLQCNALTEELSSVKSERDSLAAEVERRTEEYKVKVRDLAEKAAADIDSMFHEVQRNAAVIGGGNAALRKPSAQSDSYLITDMTTSAAEGEDDEDTETSMSEAQGVRNGAGLVVDAAAASSEQELLATLRIFRLIAFDTNRAEPSYRVELVLNEPQAVLVDSTSVNHQKSFSSAAPAPPLRELSAYSASARRGETNEEGDVDHAGEKQKSTHRHWFLKDALMNATFALDLDIELSMPPQPQTLHTSRAGGRDKTSGGLSSHAPSAGAASPLQLHTAIAGGKRRHVPQRIGLPPPQQSSSTSVRSSSTSTMLQRLQDVLGPSPTISGRPLVAKLTSASGGALPLRVLYEAHASPRAPSAPVLR